jgi:hypothetical protein
MHKLTIATLAGAFASSAASAQVVEDQNGLATQLFSGIAVVSSQSDAQVVTTGVAGTLDSVDLQIWKYVGTVNDVTIRILSATDGKPDNALVGTLYETTIAIDDLPTFDGIPPADQLPLTTVDVSVAGLVFDVGDEFAIGAFRNGVGAPPWVLWGSGQPPYEGGSGWTSGNQGETWDNEISPFGFRTFVDLGGECAADCNGDGSLDILDFVCFQGQFVAGDPAADCNGDDSLDILDFVCFQGLFQQGCP